MVTITKHGISFGYIGKSAVKLPLVLYLYELFEANGDKSTFSGQDEAGQLK
jgi:hypothetical protein